MTTPSTVLLIDDDREVVFGASLRLRASGYRALAAFDGEEGIEAAIVHRPDAILLDVRMPRLDGLAALERLRNTEATKDIPVVMVSASLVDRHAALDAGACFFLTKPYRPKTLLAAVAIAISHQGTPREACKR